MNFNLQAVMAIQRVHSHVAYTRCPPRSRVTFEYKLVCSAAIIDPIRNDTTKNKMAAIVGVF